MDFTITELIQKVDFTAIRNTIVLTVIVPAIIFAIKKEAISFFEDLGTYRNRRFDIDGDPGIGCECYLQNKATGVFDKILVKDYTFSIIASKRWVITVREAPSGEGVIVVPYTYAQWRDLIKGSLAKDIVEVLRDIKTP